VIVQITKMPPHVFARLKEREACTLHARPETGGVIVAERNRCDVERIAAGGKSLKIAIHEGNGIDAQRAIA